MALVDAVRNGVAKLAVDPVEDIDRAFLRKTKSRVLLRSVRGRDLQGEPLAAGVVVHELRHRTFVTRQQPPTDELKAQWTQLGRLQLCAKPLRQPGHQLIFLVGADLHRMAHVGAVDHMGNGGLMRQAGDIGLWQIRLRRPPVSGRR